LFFDLFYLRCQHWHPSLMGPWFECLFGNNCHCDLHSIRCLEGLNGYWMIGHESKSSAKRWIFTEMISEDWCFLMMCKNEMMTS
jgi:hypothetical protein